MTLITFVVLYIDDIRMLVLTKVNNNFFILGWWWYLL